MARTVLVLGSLALSFTVFIGLAGFAVTPAHANGAFVVNTSADINFPDSVLTLREAMLVANGALTGPFTDAEMAQLGGCTWGGSTDSRWITGGCGSGLFDAITFSSSITQVVLTTALPTLTDAGTFIDGNSGVPRIDSASVNADVFTIAGDHIAIAHLSIVNGSNTVGFADIRINSGKDARVAYNYLGLLSDSTNCARPGVTRNSYYGIYILPNGSGAAGANNAVAYIYGNSIGCHADAGVYVQGADYVYVGVRPDGTTADGNWIGYYLTGGTIWNLHNGNDGVLFQAYGTDGVRYGNISNNTIWNNLGNGIRLEGAGANNTNSTYLNGLYQNDIRYNTLSGIRLTNSAFGNLIGMNSKSNSLMSNSQDGVTVLDSNNNLIDSNLIGDLNQGNLLTGVYLSNANSNWLTNN